MLIMNKRRYFLYSRCHNLLLAKCHLTLFVFTSTPLNKNVSRLNYNTKHLLGYSKMKPLSVGIDCSLVEYTFTRYRQYLKMLERTYLATFTQYPKNILPTEVERKDNVMA